MLMQENMIRNSGLDKKEREVASALIDLGVQRPRAYGLVFFLYKKTGEARDVQEYTGLKQPEVSNLISYLRKMGWIEQELLNLPGRGRPRHQYRFIADWSQVFATIEYGAKQQIAVIERNLERLSQVLL